MSDHDYVWPCPDGAGWVDAWNGWYETEAQAREDGAGGLSGRPRVLEYGEGLITADEQERRQAGVAETYPECARRLAMSILAGVERLVDHGVTTEDDRRYETEADVDLSTLSALHRADDAVWALGDCIEGRRSDG